MNTDSLTKHTLVLLGGGESLPSELSFSSILPVWWQEDIKKPEAAAQCQINASWDGLPLIIKSLQQSFKSPGIIKISLKGFPTAFFKNFPPHEEFAGSAFHGFHKIHPIQVLYDSNGVPKAFWENICQC